MAFKLTKHRKSPRIWSFRFLFCCYTMRHRRTELKLLSLAAFPSCTNTAYNPSSRNGRLLLVSSAGPCEQVLSPADCHSSSAHGTNNNSIKKKGSRKRRWRNNKEKVKEEGSCLPSEYKASISKVKTYQSGDPLGQKELGHHVVQWLKKGMHLMASKFASSEIQDDGAELLLDGGSTDGHMGFVIQAQPYLFVAPMPKDQEALCFKASTHYPTLFDNFQRELRDVLLQHQNEGHISDWRSTQSWMLLKELAKSSEHRLAARKTKNVVMNTTLGISVDRTRLMQAKIDDFVKKMTDLLHLERDVELEFTQEELNATPVMDVNWKKPVQPVEYMVTHGQAQEQCDTICNLKVISSSTGLTGQHLVLFRVEGSHKLPPTRLSPGDMVCVRPCNSRGEAATSCMQGFVHSLGDDGCSITVALKSRRGDPSFSRLFEKSVRIDRIQALADAVTYERNCEAMMLLRKVGLQKRNESIVVVATLFGDKEDMMGLEKNNLIDWSESKVYDKSLSGYNYSFDSSQSRALALASNKKRPVLVIQGPPGTGKTGLLSYIIECVVHRGERVLVTAPSNAAVDNIVEKLSSTGLNVVRVGNPSRISPSVPSRSLRDIVAKKLQKFTEEFERKKSDLRKDLKHCIQDDSLASGIRQLLKKLGKDYKKKVKEMMKEALSDAEEGGHRQSRGPPSPLRGGDLPPPLLMRRGPTATNAPVLAREALGRSARSKKLSGEGQCGTPKGEVSAGPSKEGKCKPARGGGGAGLCGGQAARVERREVQSPYIAQVQMLRDKLEEYSVASGVEVSTIDSFQGREADAVVISMVSFDSSVYDFTDL
ncbi:hypothetical protein PR202_gb25389 [Eleusine coracana subsp. coracana]|uniref:Helicase ATP-binding domain-containing protein n=1 Tax=Eleusine coracana subsp. coracana TaxID=191504 RepID=A0AAV5FLH0_ELECO|nr:hypothetical protein PR202_gb25389 [Eleusine coracana subsp. coracana]